VWGLPENIEKDEKGMTFDAKRLAEIVRDAEEYRLESGWMRSLCGEMEE
jgi:hypothetical protein